MDHPSIDPYQYPHTPTTTRWSACFFDLDGLLIDSEAVGKKIWDNIFAQKQQKPPPYHSVEGLSLPAAVELWRSKGLCTEDCRAMQQQWRTALASIPLQKGARELLAQLQQQKIPCLLVTNSTRQSMEKALQQHQLHTYFTHCLCYEDALYPKPDPHLYTLACTYAATSPQRALVFEDSRAGVTAALGAQCATWMVTTQPQPATLVAQLAGFSPSLENVLAYIPKLLS